LTAPGGGAGRQPELFPDPAAACPPGAATGYHRLPEEARALGRPWASLVGEIAGLSPDLERDFRFGQTVFEFAGGYRLGGSVKGGSSTTWRPAPEQDFHAYRAWWAREGIPDGPEDLEGFEVLAEYLAANQIEFWNMSQRGALQLPAEYLPKRGWIYRTALEILRALPPDHVSRPAFSALQLGAWGPGSAKASAYEAGRVYIYDFALGGARRTMAGLFLHEMGHAHEAALSAAQMDELARLHAPIADAGALFGLEFLLDAESRKVYQQFLVSEFVAETYVAYSAAAPALREHIAGQRNPHTADAWQRTYDIYRETFGGWEYD
jgi:hypothetical protein